MRVYAVWFDVLLGDDRVAWDPDLLRDARVTEYWDSERSLGQWFPRQDEYRPLIFGPLAWDIFFLYGPEATWVDVPLPLVASGSTVISKRGRLEQNLLPLLSGS